MAKIKAWIWISVENNLDNRIHFNRNPMDCGEVKPNKIEKSTFNATLVNDAHFSDRYSIAVYYTMLKTYEI